MWKNEFEFQGLKVYSGFQFGKGVVINLRNFFDYSSIQNCAKKCHFVVSSGKIPTSLLDQCNRMT